MDAWDRADLVDLVQEDDAGLRAVHVEIGVLNGRKNEERRERELSIFHPKYSLKLFLPGEVGGTFL